MDSAVEPNCRVPVEQCAQPAQHSYVSSTHIFRSKDDLEFGQFYGVPIRPTKYASAKETGLARKRALIRALIEQTTHATGALAANEPFAEPTIIMPVSAAMGAKHIRARQTQSASAEIIPFPGISKT